MRYLSLGVVCFLMTTPLLAGTARIQIKPGQWETTVKTTMVGMPFSPPPQTGRICLTRKQIEHPWTQLQANKNQHCKFSDIKTHANSVSWTVECNGKGGHMTGKGMTKFVDNEHTQGTMEMIMQSDGENMKMKMHMAGRWLGTMCKNK